MKSLSQIASLLLFFTNCAFSQNLVPNASFESFTNCPTGNSQLINNVVPWNNAPGSITTPDYFNACAGNNTGCAWVDVPNNYTGTTIAFDGDAYAGIIGYYTGCGNCREYIQAPLNTPLSAGQKYHLSMQIKLGDQSNYAASGMGMYLSSNMISQNGNLPISSVTPQLEAANVIGNTGSWFLLDTEFVAVGGEQYITLGTFKDNPDITIINLGTSTSSCALAYNGAIYLLDSIIVAPVTSGAMPVVALAASDTSFCEKQCIDFFDLSTNSPTTWQWFFPGADTTSSTLQNPTGICYNSYGSFDVTLIACNAFGCDTLVFTNFINEYINPVNTIYQSNDTLYSLPFSSYQWYDVSGGLIPGATNSYYVFQVSGNYFCVATDSIGCIATSNTISNTGLQHFETESKIQLQPNPGNGNFVLSGKTLLSQAFTMNIFDAEGKLVFNKILTPALNHHLNLNDLPNGVYTVQLISGSAIQILKLVIEN